MPITLFKICLGPSANKGFLQRGGKQQPETSVGRFYDHKTRKRTPNDCFSTRRRPFRVPFAVKEPLPSRPGLAKWSNCDTIAGSTRTCPISKRDSPAAQAPKY